jgi:protein-L-isoaspartate(D-aspartate) O-methyltransferase
VTAIPTDFAVEREAMVRRQLRSRGITRQTVLDAFLEVPREAFVGSEYGHLAYGDHPLPIEAGQTISQPYIVALMIDAAGIKSGDTVLEVGTGSGYAAAVIGRIASKVIGIERQHELVEIARERMKHLGYANVEIFEGDGTRGWPDLAPYDAILAAASGSHVPGPLVDQLKIGASIVMPIGEPASVQRLVRATRRKDGTLEQSDLGSVRFVPLIGKEGWNDARG